MRIVISSRIDFLDKGINTSILFNPNGSQFSELQIVMINILKFRI